MGVQVPLWANNYIIKKYRKKSSFYKIVSKSVDYFDGFFTFFDSIS
jgi:hypothetical protein